MVPLIGGNTGVLYALAKATRSHKIAWIGDSLSCVGGQGDNFYRGIQKAWRRKWTTFYTHSGLVSGLGGTSTTSAAGLVVPSSWSVAVNGVLGNIGTYAPMGSLEWQFSGGTSGAGNYTDVPGIRIGSTTVSTGTGSTSSQLGSASLLFGGDPWTRAQGLGYDGTATMMVVQNATGINAAIKLRVRGSDNSTLAFSSAISGTANSQTFALATAAIAHTLPISSSFAVDLMYPGATATTTGKNFVQSLLRLDTGEPNGFGIQMIGEPGADLDYHANDTNLAPAFLTALAQVTDTWVIFLGTNNQTAYATNTVKTKALALVAKLRAAYPTAPGLIIAPPASASASTNSAAGGFGAEDYFVQGLYDAACQDGNCGFINLNQAGGPHTMLAAQSYQDVDGIHWTQAGGDYMATRISELIEAGAQRPVQLYSV